MKQVTLDVISDTHVDSWVGINHPEFTQELLLHKLIGKILPENPSDIIIIAGDIGHYNSQNMLFFSILKQYYKKILWVHGNHELYLISNKMKKQYEYNSFNRLNEFIKLSNEKRTWILCKNTMIILLYWIKLIGQKLCQKLKQLGLEIVN